MGPENRNSGLANDNKTKFFCRLLMKSGLALI